MNEELEEQNDNIEVEGADLHPPEGPFKLGRTAPPRGLQQLMLSNYLDMNTIPDPPENVDFTGPAGVGLSKIYMNNRLGCCVISGFLHVKGLLTANSDKEILYTDDQVVKDYSAVGGYVPGRPNTDQGCNEIDAINYYMTHGWPDGSKALGYLKVNPKDLKSCRVAAWLFEHLIYGCGLPNTWLSPSGNGFVWQAGRNNSANGHCFITPGKYDGGGFGISTWGLVGSMTNQAMVTNIAECYVLLDESLVSKINRKAPNGMDWAALIDDWNSLGGNIPKPPPMNFSWDV